MKRLAPLLLALAACSSGSLSRLMATRAPSPAVTTVWMLAPPTVRFEPLKEAVKRMKQVPLDGDTVETARDIGICFGD